VVDYWDVGKRLLSDPSRFLESLIGYDPENIPESIERRISPYMTNENFLPERVRTDPNPNPNSGV